MTPSRIVNIRVLEIRVGVTYDEIVARRKLPPEIRSFFVTMGKQGGKLGGVARAASLTPVERSESARKAVQARWSKARRAKADGKK